MMKEKNIEMKANSFFVYNGLHFEAANRRLTDSFLNISKHLKSTDNKRLRKYNNGLWNYDAFYGSAASVDPENRLKDTFICAEDGKEYVPGTNEMFEFVP